MVLNLSLKHGLLIVLVSTTNACESFYGKINSLFYTLHLSLIQFLEILKQFQTKILKLKWSKRCVVLNKKLKKFIQIQIEVLKNK